MLEGERVRNSERECECVCVCAKERVSESEGQSEFYFPPTPLPPTSLTYKGRKGVNHITLRCAKETKVSNYYSN